MSDQDLINALAAQGATVRNLPSDQVAAGQVRDDALVQYQDLMDALAQYQGPGDLAPPAAPTEQGAEFLTDLLARGWSPGESQRTAPLDLSGGVAPGDSQRTAPLDLSGGGVPVGQRTMFAERTDKLRDPQSPAGAEAPQVGEPGMAPVPSTGNRAETQFFQREADRYEGAIADEADAARRQKGAIDELARLEAQGELAAKALRDAEEGFEQRRATLKRDTAADLADVDAQIAEAASREPDPKRWWANRSGFQKLMLGLSTVFSGIGPHGRRGGPDPLQMINAEIDKDVALQQRRMDAEMNALDKSRLSVKERAEYEDQALGAEYAARNARYESVKAGLRALRTRSTSEIEKANIDKAIAGLEVERAQNNMKLGDSIAGRKIQREQMWHQMRRDELAREHDLAKARISAQAEFAKPIPLEHRSVAKGLVIEMVDADGNVVKQIPVSKDAPGVFGSEAAKNTAEQQINITNRILGNIKYLAKHVDLDWAQMPRSEARADVQRAIAGVASYLIQTRPRMTDPDLEQSLLGAGLDLKQLTQVISGLNAEDRRKLLRDAAAAQEADTGMSVMATPIDHIQAPEGMTLRYNYAPEMPADIAAMDARAESALNTRRREAKEQGEREAMGMTDIEANAAYEKLLRSAEAQARAELGRTPTAEELAAGYGVPTRMRFKEDLAAQHAVQRQAEQEAQSRALLFQGAGLRPPK